MKKILLFLAVTLGLSLISTAQSGFVSIGGNMGNAQGSVSFTYGQTFDKYIENTEANMTEGIQQPYIIRDTIYDEICQDTTSGSVYTNGNIELPITEAGVLVGEDYMPFASYYHYDSAIYINLTIHPVYYLHDTILLHDYDLPYQIVSRDDTVTIENSGETVLNLHTEYGCDSVVTMMAYVVTCPKDTNFVAPYNVCSYAIPDSLLPQPTVEPFNAMLVLTNDAPSEFQVGDTTSVTWTYTLGSLSLDCQHEIIVSFPPCGTPNDTVVDVDGNVYNTVRVACHCWTKENLRPTHYADGGDIPYAAIYSAPGHNDTVVNLNDYGRLYDWNSALNLPQGYTGEIGALQGICPDGWRVPTPEEWADLSAYGASSLKTENLWIVPGTNETEFSAVPGGYSWASTHFYNITGNAYYWTAGEYNSNNGEAFQFTYSCEYGNVIDSPKDYGYSVRCIKN